MSHTPRQEPGHPCWLWASDSGFRHFAQAGPPAYTQYLPHFSCIISTDTYRSLPGCPGVVAPEVTLFSGLWADGLGRLPHSPWSLVSAVLAQSVSSTESCCPGLGPLEADSEKHHDCHSYLEGNPRKHSGGSGEVREGRKESQ